MSNKEYISRVLKYNNALVKLKSLGLNKVFSDNIGEATGIAASQVRKDFAAMKVAGNKRGGYTMDELLAKMDTMLGKGNEKKVVVVGCGHIGQALINYKSFQMGEIKIVAGFEVDKSKVDRTAAIPIFPLEEMPAYIKKNNIQVAIIAVPDNSASEVHDLLKDAGINGILNFARVHLKETEHCIINTINIELKIENLFYFVNAMKGDRS